MQRSKYLCKGHSGQRCQQVPRSLSDDFGRVSFSTVASAKRRPQQVGGGSLEAKGFPGYGGDGSTESLWDCMPLGYSEQRKGMSD